MAKVSESNTHIQHEIEKIYDRDRRDHYRQHLQPEYQQTDQPEQPDETECHDLPGGERLQGGKFRSKRSKHCDLLLPNFHDLCGFLNIVIDLLCIVIEFIVPGLLREPISVIFHSLLGMWVYNGRLCIWQGRCGHTRPWWRRDSGHGSCVYFFLRKGSCRYSKFL